MKRELKVCDSSIDDGQIGIDRKAHPDEKGTERLQEGVYLISRSPGSQGPSR